MEEIEITDEYDFLEIFTQRNLLKKIEEFVCKYQASTQQIFRLRIYGEYTFAEIASLLNTPEATVKTRYFRLLKDIRKEFANEYGEFIN